MIYGIENPLNVHVAKNKNEKDNAKEKQRIKMNIVTGIRKLDRRYGITTRNGRRAG
jgi:hypothetical protein